MPTCIFILSRFILRVDNVLFRTFDTRFYHSFASSPPLVVRETSGWEAPYERVKRVCSSFILPATLPCYVSVFPDLWITVQQLPKRDDLTPMTDPNFIGKILSGMPSQISQVQGAGTGWRGLGTKIEVATLPLPTK